MTGCPTGVPCQTVWLCVQMVQLTSVMQVVNRYRYIPPVSLTSWSNVHIFLHQYHTAGSRSCSMATPGTVLALLLLVLKV